MWEIHVIVNQFNRTHTESMKATDIIVLTSNWHKKVTSTYKSAIRFFPVT